MKINELIREIVGEDIYVGLTSKITYYKYLRKYYTRSGGTENIPPSLIYMADGRLKHGGIADRLRGIVSLYIYSQKEAVPFYINFSHPFQLSDYLVPNEVDWRIRESEISYDSSHSVAVIVKHNRKGGYKHMNNLLRPYIGKKQIHVYTNAFVPSKEFSLAYHKLFKPSEPLLREIQKNTKAIGGPYVSVTLRFQQLLGDFKEGKFKILEGEMREHLILSCLNFIAAVKESHKEADKILVTSDSDTFLAIASAKFEYVYIIPGRVFHTDYTHEEGNLAYLKSFVDLYMLSQAQKLYCFSCGDMYKSSGFAQFAAIIGGRPYQHVTQ